MRPTTPGKLLRVHLSESDRAGGRPLYEAIVDKCRELKIAGATVLRGVEGYGETAHLHRERRGHPIAIVVVDTAENVARLIPVVESMLTTGAIAVSDVEMLRVESSISTLDKG